MILEALYFMLPAYFANMAPVFMRKHFKALGIPIDGGIKLYGRRLFGKNKTWRGLIAAVLFAVLIFEIQRILGIRSIIDYSSSTVVLGILLGLGAIIGDLVGSFVKRRCGIGSGISLPVIDQLDYPIGALLFASLVVDFSFDVVATILIFTLLLTIAANHISFYFHIRDEKW